MSALRVTEHDGHASVPAAAYRDAVRAFGEVADALAAAEDADTMLHVLARTMCGLLSLRRCSIYLREDSGGVFRGRVLHDEEQDGERDVAELDARIKRIVAGTAADAFTSEIVRTREPVQILNAQQTVRTVQATMRTWGIGSLLGVPMIRRGEVVGLLFLDDGGRQRSYTATERELATTFASLAAVAIVGGEKTLKLRQSLQTITRQNALLRRAAEMDDRLTDLVLRGGSLQEIAETAAKLTAKPCVIYDREHRRLAAAMPDWAQPGATPPRSLDAAVRAHPAVAASIAALEPKGSGVVAAELEAGLQHRCLLAPIRTPDDTLGSLVIIEQGARFGVLDLHIARRAATNAALELAAERRAAQADVDVRASLATELVTGVADHGAAIRRAEYLGIDLRAPHAVCLVGPHPPDGTSGRLSAQDVRAVLGEAGVERAVLTAGTAEGVLVVLTLDPDQHPRDAVAAARGEVAAALELLGDAGGLAAGISTRCLAPGDYVRGYQEARQVLSCLNLVADARAGLVLTADDLGPGRLFLASASREDAERFARDQLGALLDPGNEVMADLLETLRVFFDRSRSVRRSATELGVHENTIRYRLARIEDLTHLDVAASSDDQLTAQLALLILRLQGWGAGPGERLLAAAV